MTLLVNVLADTIKTPVDVLPSAEFVAVVTIQLAVAGGKLAAQGGFRLVECWKTGDIPALVTGGSHTGNGSRDK